MDHEHITKELLEKVQRSIQAYREQYPSIPAIYEMLEHTAKLQEQNAVAMAEIQANNRDLQAGNREIQASMRDLEGIVGNLATTVTELVHALTAAGRTNGKS